MNKTIIIENGKKYIELPYGRSKRFDGSLEVTDSGVYATRFTDTGVSIGDVSISDLPTAIDGFSVHIFTSCPAEYALGSNAVVRIGTETDNDICIEQAAAELVYRDSVLTILSGSAYINGICCGEGR